jgi:hypothetical protein
MRNAGFYIVESEFAQMLCDQFRGTKLAIGKFRVFMNVATPGYKLWFDVVQRRLKF